MSKLNKLKTKAKSLGKEFAYSTTGRQVARQVLNTSEKNRVRTAIKERGLENTLRRVAGEDLSDGIFFAKLTISNWRSFNGQPFRLYQNGALVYGNQIEPPARGFPLEYRNIMVTIQDIDAFTLDIDAPFSLKIGRGAFTTPQQIKYDEQYGVEQHGDVFYSLRGNTTNPKKILLTFPGFGPSTTRISYAVSYMKALTDHDLQDTLMICFQDRYLAAGSYMMVDNSGRPLYSRVKRIIDSFANRFGILDKDMMFFGASKGGSIAINYAQEYPSAHLLLAVPQMNLPYYFNKPFFRDNLFLNKGISSLAQPQDLLLNYFEEGRTIDYFYTNDDELSNRSIIEFAKDIPGLTKYRINGVHGAVARTALPAMLNLMRQFLSPTATAALTVNQARQFDQDGTTQVQIRTKGADSRPAADENWFLEGSLGKTKFRQLMTQGSPGFMKYLAQDQKLSHCVDSLADIESVTVMGKDGSIKTGSLPQRLDTSQVSQLVNPADKSPILFNANSPQTYSIINNDQFEQFEYVSSKISDAEDVLEIRLVSKIDEQSLSAPASDVGTLFAVRLESNTTLLILFIVRAVIDARLKRVVVRISSEVKTNELVDLIESAEWNNIEIQDI